MIISARAEYEGPPYTAPQLGCGSCRRSLGAPTPVKTPTFQQTYYPSDSTATAAGINRDLITAPIKYNAVTMAPAAASGWALVLLGGAAAFYFLFVRKKS
ncbi:MAG: hypothetical protein ACREJC_12980 [Tepidisphaeraceae bacterium]